MNELYRRSVRIFSLAMIVLGVILLVQTVRSGGGTVGYTVGGLFIALGVARLTMLRKT